MMICTYNARTLASDAVIGLTETRRHRPLHAVFDSGEELFLGTCDSRGVGDIGVLVNTNLAKNIDSFEQLTNRIGRLRLIRRGSMPALTVLVVVYAPTSDYDDEEVEAFYMELEKLYKEGHLTFYKVIVGDFNAKIGSRRSDWTWESPGGLHHNEIDHASCWKDSAEDNIDEEYNRVIAHIRDCVQVAESPKNTRKRLSYETLELIRQRGVARTEGDYLQTSELAKLYREAIKENLKERRVAALVDAADACKSIRNARRGLINYKTTMTAVLRPDGTLTSSIRAIEKVIHDFYSDLFDSHVHLPEYPIPNDGHVIPAVLPSEIRHVISSMKNRTAPGLDRIRSEHLKTLPPVLINTLARLFTRYLSDCKVPAIWKTSCTVLLYKKGDPHDIGNYRSICLLSVVYKIFTRVILNRIDRTIDEGQPCEQAGFRRGFSTIDHIHTVIRLTKVPREYKTPLCLTFIDPKKAFDSVETEAVIEALCKQGVSTQYVKILSEPYKGFTTVITPFYNNIRINVKRGVRQGDTISPKLFNASLENIMRTLEWDDMVVKIDGRQLHHLRIADDIVLITPSITQAERMLADFDHADFDHAFGKIGLQLNLTETMFMKNFQRNEYL
ncbi:hypothetical protein Q1695_016459 [Nippostrongylus brasiliensis]|nr:hypothetical protein Q1695_016459 [Nippostrongylus brasiliensis]